VFLAGLRAVLLVGESECLFARAGLPVLDHRLLGRHLLALHLVHRRIPVSVLE